MSRSPRYPTHAGVSLDARCSGFCRHESVVLLGQPDIARRLHVGYADIAEDERCLLGLRGVGTDVNGAARNVNEIAGFQDDLLALAAIAARLDTPDAAGHDVPAHVVVGMIMGRIGACAG